MMKPTIILAGALLCAGCKNRDDDGAKIEALARKLDAMAQSQATICSNQAAIVHNLQVLRSAEARLPDFRTVNSMMFYYHTNELNALAEGIIGSGQITLTNLYRLEAGQADLQQALSKEDSRIGKSEFISPKACGWIAIPAVVWQWSWDTTA